MLTKLHALIGGSSPVTGYLGSVIMLLDIAQQALLQGGVPNDAMGWIGFVSTFLAGLGLRFAKDANKTHAPAPVETPKGVG